MGSFSTPSPSPPGRPRRRASSSSVSDCGSVKSESKLRVRDKHDGVVERFMRSELSHGDYSFKKVWAHFKQAGWRSQNGHELSYDHYYVKPGKSVKKDVEGEDFFLGERALVSYGLRMRIFGEPKEEPLGVASPSHVQEVLLSQQQPDEYDSDDNSAASRRASRKRQRRTSRERDSPSSMTSSRQPRAKRHDNKKGTKKKERRHGSHADDPISLLSGWSSNGSDATGSEEEEGSADDGYRRGRRRKASVSSSSTSGDESWTGNDDQGGFHDPDDDLDDEEEDEDGADSSTGSSEVDDSSEKDDGEDVDDDEDEEVLDNGLEVGYGASSLAGGKMRAKGANYQSQKRTCPRSPTSQKNTRPRLKTSNGKKERPTYRQHHDHHHRSNHQQHRSEGSSRDGASNGHKRKQLSTKPSTATQQHKHQKRSSSASPESCFDDDDFSLGADRYGASPPRRPPTSSRGSVSPRRRSVSSTPTSDHTENTVRPTNHADPQRRRASVSSGRATSASHSFLSPLSQGDDNSFEVDEIESANNFDSAETQATVGEYEAPSSPSPTPSTLSPTTSTATSTSWTETPVESSNKSPRFTELTSTLLELRDVVFPNDSEADKYHVLVATQRYSAMRIVLENLRSHERRECVFRDVRELPGNSADVIPGKAVIEALLRCLRALPGADIVNPGTFSDSKEDTGKIELVRSESLATATSRQRTTAQPGPSAPAITGGSGSVTLRFAFPCFDFWRCDHNFPLKLVPSSQAKAASLMKELQASKTRLNEAEDQLKAAVRDRDELKMRVKTIEREREMLQQTLIEAKNSQLALHQRDSASELQEAQLAAQVTQLKEQVTQLKAQVAQLKDNRPASMNAISGGGSDSNYNSSAGQSVRGRQENEDEEQQPAVTVLVVVQSPWLKAFMPRITEAVARGHQSIMDWDAIVAIEKESYRADADDTTGRMNSITVLQSGTYQVNAHVTHEKSVRMALHIESSADNDSSCDAAATLVRPTLVQMYDNKRRISRADRVLSLHVNDRVAMVLLPAHASGAHDSGGAVGGGDAVPESWPPVFKPQPNQLALTYLDPQLVYDLASPGTTH